jgi:predicted DNA-binding transcriptional regulator YafY
VRYSNRGKLLSRGLRIISALRGAARTGGVTVVELAERCGGGCSARSIYRDLQAVQDAGEPLVCEAGRWRSLA